ncbi:hypothetical protein BHYA_0162g00080 [Botrytis hyacinthi]|uniref:Uncharacterized protein n=1 Tax=Botrytis hyacinthi TaxID=278943 RepID=A0A4Z1GIS8_9HELO|nr:hypothetical protein BHYA_0162g00080 [Botrytis hyacinthi]
MDRNPEVDYLDPILQEVNLLSMDPSDQTIAPELEQQNTKEYAAKIVLETSLPNTVTVPATLLSGSQQESGRKTSWHMTWHLSLDQILELAPLLKNWAGGNYRVAAPNTIATLCLTSVDSEYQETPNVLFLSRAVYGDTWEEEFALPQRHMDHYNMTMPFKYNFVSHTPYFPPPLRNKVDWYEDMVHFIIHDYIMGEWNEESHNDIGGWFDPERIVCTTPHHPQGLCEARRQFWLEYMHSSLRDWTYHREPSEFKGKGDGSGFLVKIEEYLVVTTAYDRRVPPLPWTYNGRDSFHRVICHQEGATIKDMLKAIERDINKSWGISFWETHSSD